MRGVLPEGELLVPGAGRGTGDRGWCLNTQGTVSGGFAGARQEGSLEAMPG